MTRDRAVRALTVTVLLSASLGGCDPSEPCDPGYEESHGACYKQAEPRDASTGDDGGGDEDGGDGDGDAPSPADLYEFFGDNCSDESGCPDELICGAPELPMCTQVNCLDDESLCPPDWSCTDISAFSPDPNVDSICLKQQP